MVHYFSELVETVADQETKLTAAEENIQGIGKNIEVYHVCHKKKFTPNPMVYL